MARSVEDLRLAFGLMCASDSRDPWHVALPADHAPTAERRVRVTDDLPGLDPPVREALARAATALEEHGYDLADRSGPSLEAAAALGPHIMSADGRRLWPQVAPLASPDAGRFMDAVLALTDPQDLDTMGSVLTERQRLGRAWSEHQAHTPLVVAPVSTRIPFRVGDDLDGVPAARRIVASLCPALAVNVLGLPSVAVPVGVIDGLPQAVQVIGPRFGEALCTDAAEAIERACASVTPVTPAAQS
jgi:amidase